MLKTWKSKRKERERARDNTASRIIVPLIDCCLTLTIATDAMLCSAQLCCVYGVYALCDVWEGAKIICRTLLVKMTAIIARLHMLFNFAWHCFYDCHSGVRCFSCDFITLTLFLALLLAFIAELLGWAELKDIQPRNWAIDLIFLFWLLCGSVFSYECTTCPIVQWFVSMAKAFVRWCCQLTIH